MRSLLIALLLLCCFNLSYAQTDLVKIRDTKRTPYVYLETGLGFGTHLSGILSMNVIFKRDQVISFYYFGSSHVASGVPSDYEGGLFNDKPLQSLSMSGLCYGKALYSRSPLIRYVLKGGISAGYVKTPVNFISENSGWFGPNYSFSLNRQITAGLILNPDIEFTLGRGFGFTFGVFSDINPITPVAGLETSLIFGKVRNRRTDFRQ